jgi:5-methylcytosine-specific restriction endonuclease McrA
MLRHGTRSCYVKAKCRCEPCRAANSEYLATYKERHRTRVSDVGAARYRREKDRIVAYVNAYYERERETIRERQKRPTTLAKRARTQLTRIARKLDQFVEDVDPIQLLEMHQGLCGICGETITDAFHVDHVMPLSRGGLHAYRNAQPAHPGCNMRKHDRLPTIEELERQPITT